PLCWSAPCARRSTRGHRDPPCTLLLGSTRPANSATRIHPQSHDPSATRTPPLHHTCPSHLNRPDLGDRLRLHLVSRCPISDGVPVAPRHPERVAAVAPPQHRPLRPPRFPASRTPDERRTRVI